MFRTVSVLLCSVVLTVLAFAAGKEPKTPEDSTAVQPADSLAFPGERHLTNIRQLTFGGQNAEAYWNFDGTRLIFQSTRDGRECDAIYTMNADGSDVQQVSSGKGTTTCAFISPDGESIVYASTHLVHDSCPPKPDMSRGYVWALYKAYDIFKANPDGSNLQRLTETDGYDAEAVYSPKGDRIIFTSVRSGDLELYTMNPDGTGIEQITHEPGYDGGAFFSRDGEWIVWRASRPKGAELEEYKALLADGLIRPSKLEIYVMNLKDRKPIQLTANSAANFAPYFHPDGTQVIFCSNMNDPKGRNFDLFMVNIRSKKVEQITHNDTFDGFPMFTHDGKRLVFASNRNGAVEGETNIFVADWKK